MRDVGSPETRNRTAVTMIAGTTFHRNPIREMGTAAILHRRTTIEQEMMLFCISEREMFGCFFDLKHHLHKFS